MSLALLTSAPESTEGHVAQVEARLIPSPEWTKDGKVQGDVYLTPDRVVFYSSQAQRGLSLGYTHLGLHAVGRLEDGRMHVYCQLDGLIPTKESLEAEDQLAPGKRRHEETEGSVDEAMTELYLIPETDDQGR
ncbi:MAG: hypothetical protein DHS80DRAFT_15284 [Piptocephalis tieghemiana]|nr:MAG: hypothetical protein DHS80DRAFT_15284 [Piptocephalis tieghemiana]